MESQDEINLPRQFRHGVNSCAVSLCCSTVGTVLPKGFACYLTAQHPSLGLPMTASGTPWPRCLDLSLVRLILIYVIVRAVIHVKGFYFRLSFIFRRANTMKLSFFLSSSVNLNLLSFSCISVVLILCS